MGEGLAAFQSLWALKMGTKTFLFPIKRALSRSFMITSSMRSPIREKHKHIPDVSSEEKCKNPYFVYRRLKTLQLGSLKC